MIDGTPFRTGDATDERLARIAELVGRPVEAFRAPESDALGEALELVKLWERIDRAGRARLLACARAEATRTGDPQRPAASARASV
ncbi:MULTISPECIES: hypothetical protein [Methylobacterium]|jgi:hypothetical protein|uniref:Uncharacterized protein n=1 Tax=Methylobacterium hispanicum TaxID=270350 RepID=A0AAV4ZEW6_9HYPH|nr:MULTISPECIES: hypothetical protein [Methylobacterium]GJD86757.1 hypothetical protein BHAOGJBA_0253 [Methylobacterium hispanicum]